MVQGKNIEKFSRWQLLIETNDKILIDNKFDKNV